MVSVRSVVWKRRFLTNVVLIGGRGLLSALTQNVLLRVVDLPSVHQSLTSAVLDFATWPRWGPVCHPHGVQLKVPNFIFLTRSCFALSTCRPFTTAFMRRDSFLGHLVYLSRCCMSASFRLCTENCVEAAHAGWDVLLACVTWVQPCVVSACCLQQAVWFLVS